MQHKTKRTTSRQNEKNKQTFYNKCKQQNQPCWICGQPIDYTATKNTTDNSYNLDHYIPVSKNPTIQHDPANWRPSHTSCNNLRNNKDPKQPLGTLSRNWNQPQPYGR